MVETYEITEVQAAIIDGVCLMTVVDGHLDPNEIGFLHSMIATLLEVDPDVAGALIQNSMHRIETLEP